MQKKLKEYKATKQFVFLGILMGLLLSPGFIWFKEYMSIQALLFPIIFIVLVLAIKDKSKSYSFTFFDLGFLILLIGEIGTTVFSSYVDNSLSSLTRFVVVFFLYLFYKIIIGRIKDRFWISILFFFFSSILLVATAGSFVTFYTKIHSLSYSNIYDLKHLYHPLSVLKNGTLNNVWASSLLLFIPFNIVFLLHQKKLGTRIAVIFILVLNIFCVFVSFSRGVYISLFVFLLLVNLLSFKYFQFKKIILYNALALLLMLPSAILVKDSFLTTVSFDKTVSQKRSTYGRKLLWEHTLKNLTDKPLFGYGQRNFKLATENNPLVKEDIVFPNRTNNTYFQILIERGIFGISYYLLFFLLVSVIVLKNLSRKKRDKNSLLEIIIIYSGILAFLTREFTFSSLLDNDFVYYLSFYLLISLVPYDIVITDLTLNGYRKKGILILAFMLVGTLMVLNGKRALMIHYNNKSVDFYYEKNITKSNEFLDKALLFSTNDLMLNKHKAMVLSMNKLSIELSEKHDKLISFKGSNQDSLTLSLEYLLNVLKEVPSDDEILHNVSWIYFALDKLELAKKYVDRSIELNPYNSAYQVTSVLLNLQYFDFEMVAANLSKALRYSPSLLESKFYHVFSAKYGSLALQAKQEAISGLSERLETNNSLIFKARLARFLMEDNPEESLELLREVTSKLPNLNRPWLYMAHLENKKGNTLKAEEFFEKAMFYNRNDVLTRLYMAKYDRSMGMDKDAVHHFKRALKMYKPTRMSASAHNLGIEKMDNIPTSYFLNDFLFYLKPDLNASGIFSYFKDYYGISSELSIYYDELSKKYKDSIYKGEEAIR